VPEEIRFTVNGQQFQLSRAQVLEAMRNVEPGPLRSHSVVIEGTRYPVKQVFAQATGLDLLDFQTAVARRHLGRLGFELSRSS
jgi:hypothetical protein